MKRKQNFQTISWFWDLYNRDRLNLEPPYQRRSVWNQAFKDYFVDTLLLSYPVPSIFVYEDITPDGMATYHVVDGKQRLTTIFEFVDNQFSISEEAQITEYKGKYFKDLDNEVKTSLWRFQFSVEYLPIVEESVINTIFDRINRNTAYLKPQELRHARLRGEFITSAENLAGWFMKKLPTEFPKISPKSLERMEEVEFVAQLLLLLEEGPCGYTRDELDKAFSDRDQEWELQYEMGEKFRQVTLAIGELVQVSVDKPFIQSRFKNKTDFYSLFGAITNLIESNELPQLDLCEKRLQDFAEQIGKEEFRKNSEVINAYYKDTQIASSQGIQRKRRIETLIKVLKGYDLKDVGA
ncbi:DUF262 domain-containing protein [Candidatus Parabeggiatoa sp. HSG14]|uniref:DUF262 domain-containing protein n=1 Tax=Candidatus Parabeggiatoa sp. HSG14 TaxID=3055593 RepID=UPI0025A92893|nr:DUF262 domain-containing protein [Thiotrichales bacterium HSG14]